MASVKSAVQRRVYRRRRNRTSNEHQQVNRCVPKVNQRPFETKTKQTNPTRLVVAWNKTSTGIELEYGTVWIELETRRRYTYEAASLCPQCSGSVALRRHPHPASDVGAALGHVNPTKTQDLQISILSLTQNQRAVDWCPVHDLRGIHLRRIDTCAPACQYGRLGAASYSPGGRGAGNGARSRTTFTKSNRKRQIRRFYPL